MIDALREQLDRFDVLLQDVYLDNVVDFDEFLSMREARKQILEHTLNRALADGRITTDERQLLVRIIEMLPLIR